MSMVKELLKTTKLLLYGTSKPQTVATPKQCFDWEIAIYAVTALKWTGTLLPIGLAVQLNSDMNDRAVEAGSQTLPHCFLPLTFHVAACFLPALIAVVIKEYLVCCQISS